MQEITRFLQEIPPFSQLPDEQNRLIAEHIQIEYFPEGHDIIVYQGTPAAYLYIIQRGSVDLLRENEGVQVFDTLSEGDLFAYPSLIRKKSPIVTVRTREETLAYLIPAATFDRLRREYPVFARYFAASTIERLTHRLQARQANASPELFGIRLRDLIQRRLISAPPDITIRQAANIMSEHNVSSLVVESTPPGIVTDRDLRNRVLAAGFTDDAPITTIMTSPVLALSSDSLVFEALLTMLERGFHHLPVEEKGQIVGLVTHTDILRRQSKSPLFLPRQLERASSMHELKAYTDHVTATVGNLLDEGARVSDIGRVVAVAHDALLVRLLQDAERYMGPPPCPYAWLVLGSEGRYEQTLRTDQDNALIYADDAPPDAPEYFSALADRIVQQLVECGFPPCPGYIMANNPYWRQPLHVWQSYFYQWINNPKEEALLRVSIFFDYRQIYGTLPAEPALRPIIQGGSQNKVFLGRLARVALRQHAPISFFRQLVLERSGEAKDLIDLKARGTALIVDLARLYCIQTGCVETNTPARLRASSARSGLSETGAEELIAAFELISLLRLRYQYQQIRAGKEPQNHVPVSWLSALERRELKEVLWAVERIQQSVELSFQIDLFA